MSVTTEFAALSLYKKPLTANWRNAEDVFSNVWRLKNGRAQIQAVLMRHAFRIDRLTALALAHTCRSYFEVHTALERKAFTIKDLYLDARNPDVICLRKSYAASLKNGEYYLWRRPIPASPEELSLVIHRSRALSVYAFEEWLKPDYIPQSKWFGKSYDAYRGVKISCGAVLTKSGSIEDSLFGTAITELWVIPKSAQRAEFTVSDVAELYTGRYKKEAYDGRPDRRYSKHWGTDRNPKPIIFTRHVRGWLPFEDNPKNALFCETELYMVKQDVATAAGFTPAATTSTGGARDVSFTDFIGVGAFDFAMHQLRARARASGASRGAGA